MHDGSKNLSGTRLIDEDVTGCLAGLADEGHFTKTYLHQLLEVVSQESVYQEDVEGSLVIGHEHIRGVFAYVRVTLHSYGEQKHVAEEDGPNLARPIAPEMGVADAAADDDGEACDDGHYQQDGQCNEQLIEEVKYLHNK